MSAQKTKAATISASNRSAVTNGSALFPGDVDMRSATARRMRDLIEDYTSQVGGDPSPALNALIRNAAALSALLEDDQGKIAQGQTIDDELFLKRCGMLSRLLKEIGLKRRAKDITKPDGPEIDGHARLIREAARA